MKAGYVLLGLILGSIITIAALNTLPTTNLNLPIIPTKTTTQTLTKTQTKTAWKTTTETSVSTKTITKTTTQTKTLPVTTTLTTTKTSTTTKTQTTTKTETLTTTTTATITKTITENSFQYLSKPNKVIQLVANANKTLIVYVPYAELNWNWKIFAPTVGKILNATLQAHERGADVYVVVAYHPICDIEVNTTFIKYLNRLNATLPPKHVLEAKDEHYLYTYPFRQHFLVIAMIDFKYMALIEPGLHPPTNDTQHTYLINNPQAINKTMHTALEILHNFDNPNFYNCFYCDIIWVWDGCKKHESPWG